jgi:glyoxylase-like metal-dependent hydrolase (beta-lactamase superfamily II)
MSVEPSYRVLAVHYGDRDSTLGDVYHRWSTYGEPDGPLRLAYYFWVLQPLHAPGAPPTVVDTGFKPQRGEEMGGRCLVAPNEAFLLSGVDAAGVERLVISHLHYDHIGNVDLFPNARITISRDDYEFWVDNPIAKRPQFSRFTDWEAVETLVQAHADGRVDLIGPRANVAPGIDAIQVGGHSPGQLIFDIAGEHGPLTLVGDAVHFYAELEHERPFGVFADLEATYLAYTTIREKAAAGATIVPGHDPEVMRRFDRSMGDAGSVAVSLTGAEGEHIHRPPVASA